jgi:hypothetical protein
MEITEKSVTEIKSFTGKKSFIEIKSFTEKRALHRKELPKIKSI